MTGQKKESNKHEKKILEEDEGKITGKTFRSS
jgi:hypothetical protein